MRISITKLVPCNIYEAIDQHARGQIEFDDL